MSSSESKAVALHAHPEGEPTPGSQVEATAPLPVALASVLSVTQRPHHQRLVQLGIVPVEGSPAQSPKRMTLLCTPSTPIASVAQPSKQLVSCGRLPSTQLLMPQVCRGQRWQEAYRWPVSRRQEQRRLSP